MRTTSLLLAVVAFTLALPRLAEAGQATTVRTLQLDFHADGTVSLSAQHVTVREILSEWARQCGCHLVNWSSVGGDALGVPVLFERTTQGKVLESLLRQTAGFVLTPRREGSQVVSNFETIYILPPNEPGAKASAALDPVAAAQSVGLGTFDVGEPAPREPSPEQQEFDRLFSKGSFNMDAKEESLLGLAISPNPEVRSRALQTLAVQARPAGYHALTAALDDPDPTVRAEALDLLLSQGTPNREAILRFGDLLMHRDPVARSAAVMILGERSGPEVDDLLKRAASSDDGVVKEAAAEWLRQREVEKEEKKNERPAR